MPILFLWLPFAVFGTCVSAEDGKWGKTVDRINPFAATEIIPGVRSDCVGIECLRETATIARGQMGSPPQCTQDCALTYNTSNSCNSDDACRWSAILEKCLIRCESFDHPDLCNYPEQKYTHVAKFGVSYANLIFWTPQKVKWYSQYCLWDPAAGSCATRCPHLSVRECAQNSICRVSDDGRRCIHKCSEMNGGFFIDDFNATGVYNVTSLDNITSDVVTDWNRRTVCYNSYAGYCSYAWGVKQCEPSCFARYMNNRTACDANTFESGECIWSNSTGVCVENCMTLSEDLCNQDGTRHCYWNEARQECMLQCRMIFHPQAVVNNATVAAQCDAHPHCTNFGFLLKSSHIGTCTDSCRRFNGNYTGCMAYSHTDIDWQATNNAAGPTFPNVVLGLCTFNPTTEECVTSCENFNSSASCAAVSYCQWNDRIKTCLRQCSLLSVPTLSRLGVDNSTERTQFGCTSQYTKGMCVLRADGVCASTCNRHMFAATSTTKAAYQATCDADPDCTFVDDVCRQTCDRLAKDSCSQQPHCKWDSTTFSCSMKCAYLALTTADTCNAQSACEWLGTLGTFAGGTRGCADRCEQMTTLNDCIVNQANCIWSFATDTCVRNCRVLDATLCSSYASTCVVVGTDCHFKCDLATTESNCTGAFSSSQYSTAGDYAGMFAQPCQWRNTTSGDACVARCEYRHQTQAACNTDTDCEWFAAPGRCGFRCSRALNLSSPDRCDSVDCRLFGAMTTPTCAPRCSVKYNGQAECAADPNCVWLTTRCNDACSTLENSTWECGGHFRDNSRHPWNAWHCVLEPTPMNENVTACQLDCPWRHSDQAQCVADARCVWTASGCKRNCDTTLPDDGNCSYYGKHCAMANAMCVVDCSYLIDADCTAASGRCEWSGAQMKCVATCSGQQYWECKESYPRCMWHGKTGFCRRHCADQHATEIACNADVGCVWYNVSVVTQLNDNNGRSPQTDFRASSCMPRCSILTLVECETQQHGDNPGCEYQMNPNGGISGQTKEAFCTTTLNACQGRYNEAGCTVDGECMWLPYNGTNSSNEVVNPNHGHCVQNCAMFHGQPTYCARLSSCIYNSWNETCVPRCSIRFPNVDTFSGQRRNMSNVFDECTNALWQCDWKESTPVCQDSCLVFQRTGGDYPSIPASLSCTFTNGVRVPSGSVATQAACYYEMGRGRTQFKWYSGAGSCLYDCEQFSGTSQVRRSICRSFDWCVSYPDGRCGAKCNTLHNDAGRCGSDTECRWTGDAGNSCVHRCENFTGFNATDCNFNSWIGAECNWNVTTESCTRNCGNNTKTRCTESAFCEWFQNGNIHGRQCLSMCRHFTTEDLCINAVSYCTWSNVTGCQSDCQKMWTDEAGCTSSDHCYWQRATSTCRRNCNQTKGSEDCARITTCAWDTGYRDGQQLWPQECVFKCSLRYGGTSLQQQTNCTADPECYWHSSTATCRAKCEAYLYEHCPTSTTDGCFASAYTYRCARKCGFRLNQTECEWGSECAWTGTTCHQCHLHTTEVACRTDSMCMYFGMFQNNCQLRCNYHNGTECLFPQVAAQSCQVTNLGCREPCAMLSPTMCFYASAHCRWDYSQLRCVDKCETRFNNFTCEAGDTACELKYPMFNGTYDYWPTCFERCEFLDYQSCMALSSNGTGQCVWNILGFCERNCAQYYFPATRYDHVSVCRNHIACELWFPTASAVPDCRQKCERVSQSSCASLAHCIWSSVEKKCFQRCQIDYPTIGTNSGCNIVGTCTFDKTSNGTHPSCRDKCRLFDTPSTCNSQSHCVFAGNRAQSCMTRCASLEGPSPSACSTSYCSLIGGTCYEKCDLFSEQPYCDSNIHCVWKEGKCSLRCRFKYWGRLQRNCRTIDDSCDSAQGEDGWCDDACSVFDNPHRCVNFAPSYCTWSNDTKQCMKNCWTFPDEDSCIGDNSCEWQPLHGATIPTSTCRPKCALFLNETSCMEFNRNVGGSFVHFCEWSRATEQCLSSCFQRYTHDDNAGLANDTFGPVSSCARIPHCQTFPSYALPAAFAPVRTYATGAACLLNCTHRTNRTACDKWHRDCHWFDGQCFVRCSAKHGANREACLSDSNQRCDWFPSRGIAGECGDPCEQFSGYATSAQCHAAGCDWEFQTSSCVTLCQDLYSNWSSCLSDVKCGWSTTLSKCVPRCQYFHGSIDDCPGSRFVPGSECVWVGSYRSVAFSLNHPIDGFNASSIKKSLYEVFSFPGIIDRIVPKFQTCRLQYFTAVLVGTYDQLAEADWTLRQAVSGANPSSVVELALRNLHGLAMGDPVPPEEDIPLSAAGSVTATLLLVVTTLLLITF